MVNPGEPMTVKLYGNQRLYQPGAARYVTLSDLKACIRVGPRRRGRRAGR